MATLAPTAWSTFSRTAMWAWMRRTFSIRFRMSSRSSSIVSNSLASLAHSSSASGRTFRLVSLTMTWKATSSPARSPHWAGSVSLNFSMSPGRLPSSSSSSFGTTSLEPTS